MASFLPVPSTARLTSRSVDFPFLNGVRHYLFSLPSLIGLFFFTTTTVALLVHKILIIRVHGPFSGVETVFLGPFTFCFDFLTLYVLHRAFNSSLNFWRSLAALVCFSICACSSTFVSMYMVANAEISWGRSIAVYSISYFGLF